MAFSPMSFLLGLGAGYVMPIVSRNFRPLIVEATAVSLGLIEDLRRMLAVQMENLEDIAAEARARREELAHDLEIGDDEIRRIGLEPFERGLGIREGAHRDAVLDRSGEPRSRARGRSRGSAPRVPHRGPATAATPVPSPPSTAPPTPGARYRNPARGRRSPSRTRSRISRQPRAGSPRRRSGRRGSVPPGGCRIALRTKPSWTSSPPQPAPIRWSSVSNI